SSLAHLMLHLRNELLQLSFAHTGQGLSAMIRCLFFGYLCGKSNLDNTTDSLLDGAGCYVMFFVIFHLDTASSVGLINSPPHRVSNLICIHDHLTLHIPGSTA